MKSPRRKRDARPKRLQPPRREIGDLTPPEGVPLRFEVAGLGARFGAQLVDIALCMIVVIALVVFLAAGVEAPDDLTTTVGALSFFMIRAPYYMIAELLWNGATLGKRFMRIRVIAADGRSLSVHSIVVRNMMKEAEIFMPGTLLIVAEGLDAWAQILIFLWIVIVLGVPLFNRRRQRLGDIIAGTYVIRRPVALLVPDLAAAPAAPAHGFVFQPHQLEHYGAYELQTLEKLLQARPAADAPATALKRREETLIAVVDRIRAKIGFGDAVGPDECEAFLRAFYNAQRAHLEQRQLFGDRRADKHHAEVG